MPSKEIPQIVKNKNSKNLVTDFIKSKKGEPLFLNGDSLEILKNLPDGSIDFIMTSPPYWQKRQYADGGIGLEDTHEDFMENLAAICAELYRILKPTGSFWLNLGDSYDDKNLLNLPWVFAEKLKSEQNWILRNCVIWNKLKGGMDTSKDRLGNVYEPIFHFVKQKKDYFYDTDAIRKKARSATVENGKVISATGVSGVRYRRQIELSTALNADEKKSAFKALDEMLDLVKNGKYSDFRMVIRGQQRTTHSDKDSVSGRAKELLQKGFYFLRYHPNGAKPSDLWDILPEDTQRKDNHFAPFPKDLCILPLLSTCPKDGIALDPFCGTGTLNLVATELGIRSIGIDLSNNYLDVARKRCRLN